jgi:WD40 repeat protein
MAEGLAAAHAQGVIHRDLKPANVWLEPGDGRAKLLDFGLARAVGDDARLTQSGTVVGTPSYLAPEQARGEPVDGRSDLFSLGCVLYRMATGRLPFEGPNTMAVLTALATVAPPEPRAVNAALPRALSELIVRLLAKEAAARPGSAAEVIATLRGLSGGAAPTGGARAGRRRWKVVAVAALLLVALGAAVAGITIIVYDRDGKKRVEIHITEDNKGKTKPDNGKPVNPKQEKAGDFQPLPIPPLPAKSPLDQLDASKIPAAERYEWQRKAFGKELVAVLGQSRQQLGSCITGLVVSPDGKYVFANCLYRPGQGEVFDAATMDRVAGPVWYPKVNYPAVFHPTKPLIGAQGLWNVAAAEPVRVSEAPACYMDHNNACSFSPDGRWLTTCSWHSESLRVIVYDISDPQAPREWGRFPGAGRAAISADSKQLAVVFHEEKRLRLYDLTAPGAKETAVITFRDVTPWTPWADFLADGRLVTLGSKALTIWEIRGGAPREMASEPCSDGRGYNEPSVLSPDRKRLAHAPGGSDHVDLWELSGARPLRAITLQASHSNIRALSFTPDGRYLITGSLNGAVRKWDVSGEVPKEATPFREEESYKSMHVGEAIILSPDGRFLVLHNFGPRVWDLGQAAPREVSVEGRPPYFCGFRDQNTLIGGAWMTAQQRPLQYWTVAGESAKPVRNALGPVTFHVRVSPDGKTWAGRTQQHSGLWGGDLTDEKPEARFQDDKFRGHAFPEFTPDGKRLVFPPNPYNQETDVRVLDVSGEQPRELRRFATGVLRCLALHPDGVRITGGTEKDGVRIWNLNTGKPETGDFKTLAGRAFSVAFSPDGTCLLGTSEGGDMVLWDVASGLERWRWQFPWPVFRARFTADGRHILTLNGDGTVYVLRLQAPAKK